MFQSKKALWLLTLLFGATVLFTGCEKKEQPAATTTTPPADTVQAAPPPPAAPALSGTWSGKFGERKMTMKITAQTGNDFEGETTVNWPANKLVSKVKGMVDPTTKKMTFEDTERGKFAGMYEGMVSEDGKSFTGKFSLNSDPKKTYDITLKMD